MHRNPWINRSSSFRACPYIMDDARPGSILWESRETRATRIRVEGGAGIRPVKQLVKQGIRDSRLFAARHGGGSFPLNLTPHTKFLTDPAMVRDNRRQSVYLYGAICPARGVGAAIIMPAADTPCMNEHLSQISLAVAPKAHAVLLCDGAGWHAKSKDLVVPPNITLVTLPSYSPELNTMENIWAFLRGNRLCGKIWKTSTDIINDCADAWNWLVSQPERITSIGTREWMVV